MNKAEVEGYVAAAAWEAWPDLDIDGEITGRNLRCLRCGWQTKYKTGRRRAAIRKHKCPHTAENQATASAAPSQHEG